MDRVLCARLLASGLENDLEGDCRAGVVGVFFSTTGGGAETEEGAGSRAAASQQQQQQLPPLIPRILALLSPTSDLASSDACEPLLHALSALAAGDVSVPSSPPLLNNRAEHHLSPPTGYAQQHTTTTTTHPFHFTGPPRRPGMHTLAGRGGCVARSQPAPARVLRIRHRTMHSPRRRNVARSLRCSGRGSQCGCIDLLPV